jgi:hypothetical protein
MDPADRDGLHLVTEPGERAWPADPLPPRAQRLAQPPAGRHSGTSPRPGDGLLARVSAVLPKERRGLLGVLAAVAAVAILGASILGGVAWTHGTAAAQSAPYHSYSVSGAQAGTAAGFTMAVPTGWQEIRRGPSTDFSSPADRLSIGVTPTSFGGAGAAGEALRLQAQAVRNGTFPGYQPIAVRPFHFRGGLGVAWAFTWQPLRGGRAEVLDVALRLATPAGHQAYLVRESAPAVDWTASQPVFSAMLRTFRTHA